MNGAGEILVVGGYGEVGGRLSDELRKAHGDAVVVGGRNPEVAGERNARRIDVQDPSSIEKALDGVSTVVACVRQREPHLLDAAIKRGIAYTSIAPPPLDWSMIERLHADAQRTGARIVYGTGIEPGISSILARVVADRLGSLDAIETALLLSLGDVYGVDSMGFIFDTVKQAYTVISEGRAESAHAFDHAKRVMFPTPFGPRRAYRMPFTDQLYYPNTLGAKTAIARIALEPKWIGDLVSGLTHLGLRALMARRSSGSPMHQLIARLRMRYAGQDGFALVVEGRGDGGAIRASLSGHQQAGATAMSAWATTEALHRREMTRPGVWLAEQVIAPEPFLQRLATHGFVPQIEELAKQGRRQSTRTVHRDQPAAP